MTSKVLTNILSVQISACYADPLLDLLDIYGTMMKYIIGPLFSVTQGDLNAVWTGRKWKLAGTFPTTPIYILSTWHNNHEGQSLSPSCE